MPRSRLIAAALLLPFILTGCTRAPNTDMQGGCGCGNEVQPDSEQDLQQNVGDREFFVFDKFFISADAKITLNRQAAWLAKYPSVKILIAGNADERGTETYNLALGQRRADAARDYLVVSGVVPSRIETISYGKDCPIETGHGELAWAGNRAAITSVQGFNPQPCATP